MIFVVDATCRRSCALQPQSTRPVFPSTSTAAEPGAPARTRAGAASRRRAAAPAPRRRRGFAAAWIDLRLPRRRRGRRERRRRPGASPPSTAEPGGDDRDADGREPAQAIPVALPTARRHRTILRRGAARFPLRTMAARCAPRTRSARASSPSSRRRAICAAPRRRSIPRADDRSTLLVTAGMQPQMPYFLGREPPPARATTLSQKCFRTRRHRRGRPRHLSPDVLRDARQLLVRRLLQGRRDRLRDRVHPASGSSSTGTGSG